MFESLFETLGALPVSKVTKSLVRSLLSGVIVIIASNTGSGKTLLIPPEIARESNQPVLVLEPRRFLAVNAAETVSHLAGLTVGNQVGYAVGAQSGEESRWDEKTNVLYCTYGYAIASRRIFTAPIVVFDEVHEQSLDMSICRALVRYRREQGQQVYIVEMSATLNAEQQAAYWQSVGPTRVVTVDGQTFACERRHRPGSTIEKEVKILLDEGRTGILVFRPGKGEVEETATAIRTLVGADVEVAEIYGELDYLKREAAVAAPTGKAKVLVGTNVVESGANIPWLDAGVSCGTGKEISVRLETGAIFLKLIDLPQWRLIQQEGRVKRFRDGIFVLCSPTAFEARETETTPEIWRLPLTALVMHCATSGMVAQDLTFDYPPEKARILQAEVTLQRLGLVDAACQLTPAGQWVANLPVGPATGAMLWFARQTQCLGAALPLAAVLEIDGIREDFRTPHGLDKTSDWLDALKAFKLVLRTAEVHRPSLLDEFNISLKRYEAAKEMLKDLDKRLDAEATATLSATEDQLRLCLTAGFITNLFAGTRNLRMVTSPETTSYQVGRSSVVRPPHPGYLVGQLHVIQPKETEKQPFTVLEKVTQVTPQDLEAIAKVRPELFTTEETRQQAGYFAFKQVTAHKLFGIYPLNVQVEDSPLTETEEATQATFEEQRARFATILQGLNPLRQAKGLLPVQLRREVFYLGDAYATPYPYTEEGVAQAKADNTKALNACSPVSAPANTLRQA